MSLQREIMSPTTTTSMLYPALSQQIVQIAMPNMVARQFYQQYSLTASNSVTFPKQSGTISAVVQRIAEGTDIPLDVTAYTQVNVAPYKIAQGFVVTKEMIEDQLIPIQQDQLVRAALRFANKIDADCIAAIGAGTGSSVTASGKSLAFDGTEFVISGSGGPGVGTYDIINAKAKVEQYNYMPDTLLCHPLAKTHIEKLPHFTSLMHYGQPILQEGLIQVPGKFGDILGLDAYSSTNCPTGSIYVLSRGKTSNIMGQYSPMGMFVERRPITTGIKALEEKDSVGVYITARYAPVILQGNTIAAIQGINVT
jgi:HK97 family phage major capsid protein